MATATHLWFTTHYTQSFQNSVLRSLKGMMSNTTELEDYMQDYARKVLNNDGFAKHLANPNAKISPRRFAQFCRKQAINSLHTSAQDANNRAQRGVKTKREVELDKSLASSSTDPQTVVTHLDDKGQVVGSDIMDASQVPSSCEIEARETYRAIFNTISKLESCQVPQQHLGSVLKGFMEDIPTNQLAEEIGRSPVRARVMLSYLRKSLQEIGKEQTEIMEVLSEVSMVGKSRNTSRLVYLSSVGLVQATGKKAPKKEWVLTEKGEKVYGGSIKHDPTSWVPVVIANEPQELVEEPIVETPSYLLSDDKVDQIFGLTSCFTMHDPTQSKCGTCPMAKHCKANTLKPKKVESKVAEQITSLTGCFGSYQPHTSKCSLCPLARHCIGGV